MTLISTDYNEDYFENQYYCKRWYRTFPNNTWTTGEHQKDIAKKLFETYNLSGKKVLDIGCGLGCLVKDLRELGALADGIDFSSYAVGIANSPYITLQDARTYVKGLKNNEYDLIVMVEFLSCLTDAEITQFIKDVGKKAVDFFILERRDFDASVIADYNPKLLTEWQTYFPEVEVIWREGVEEWLFR